MPNAAFEREEPTATHRFDHLEWDEELFPTTHNREALLGKEDSVERENEEPGANRVRCEGECERGEVGKTGEDRSSRKAETGVRPSRPRAR